MKVRDVIRSSFLKIGVLAAGEDPAADQLQDAIFDLSLMLDTWSSERLFISKLATEAFTFNISQSKYTMGPGGDFDTTRPMFFEACAIRVQYGTPEQVDIPCPIMNADEWADLSVKNTQGVFPTRMWPNFTDTLVELNFWPIPTTVQQVYITSWKPLLGLNNADLDVMLPPGFAETIIYNLALRLCPSYGKEPSGTIAALANSTKAKLKTSIGAQKNYLMRVDEAISSKQKVFNYLTGEA